MMSQLVYCAQFLFTTTVDSDEESEMSEVIILLVTLIVSMYKLSISHFCDVFII